MEYLKLLPANVHEDVIERMSILDYYNLEIVSGTKRFYSCNTDETTFRSKFDIYVLQE